MLHFGRQPEHIKLVFPRGISPHIEFTGYYRIDDSLKTQQYFNCVCVSMKMIESLMQHFD
jgi:hypothetical protein